MIRIPISVGEAVDKLTILDIKCKRVTDPERLVFCKREYELLFSELHGIVSTFQFYYDKLVEVNDTIWTTQDEVRSATSPNPLKYTVILDMNDVRCRIKDIITRMSESTIREVKGYPKRTALFLSHMGLGDHIGLNGAVQYLSLRYDELHLACLPQYTETLRAIYSDNPLIKLLPLPLQRSSGWCASNPWEWVAEVNSVFPTGLYTDVYRSGLLKPISNIGRFPVGFYWDLDLDPDVRHTYFHIVEPKESAELYSHVKDKKYIFVHEKSSNHFVKLVTWDTSEVLTLDPNANHYDPLHPWWDLAQRFVDAPFFHYCDVVRNATELHLVDSAFYCLATHLRVRVPVKLCYDRHSGKVMSHYNFT